MAASDSPDHFFSSMEVLSADTSPAAGDYLQPPPYADDSILICSLPETPNFRKASASAAKDAPPDGLAGPGTGATQDPSSKKSPAEQPCYLVSSNSTQSFPAKKNISAVPRRRIRGAKIRSSDSDEEKQDDALGIERLENENGNPRFPPEAHVDGENMEDCDVSAAKAVPLEQQQQRRPSFLDVVKMMSGKLDRRFEDTDILEIAVMKGIEFPPPRWWKPGGYGVQKPEDLEQV